MRSSTKSPGHEQAERKRAKQAAYRALNQDLLNAKARERYWQNPWKERARKTLYRQINWQLLREKGAEYRHKQRVNEDSFFHFIGQMSALARAMESIQNENRGGSAHSGTSVSKDLEPERVSRLK